MIVKLLIYIAFLAVNGVLSFPFTLPGEAKWPNKSEFLQLRSLVKGRVILKGDNDYNPHTWNRITNVPKPAVIIEPINSNDIIEALKFAKKYNIRLSVQSTGHHQDHRNIYDNSVHIDMVKMNSISIDLVKRTLTLGPGNNFSVIQEFVATQSNNKLVALGGADRGVGIYGWTTGGGHGPLTRMYGLGVDALLSIDIIISNLTIITASETQNQELFRALRGSGGSAYGIAVSLTVRLYDDPGNSSRFSGVYELSETSSSMFANWMINAPNFAGAYYIMTNFDEKYVFLSAHCFSNASTCTTVLQPLTVGCIPTTPDMCNVKADRFKNYYEFFNSSSSETGGVVYLSSTAFNSGNIISALGETTKFILNNKYTGCSANSILGGVSSTIDITQVNTSVSTEMRTSLMAITCYSAMLETDKVNVKQYQADVMDKLSETVFKKYSKWVYWNEPQHNFPTDDWKERYWGNLANYNTLSVVKKQYDPNNFFSCYHCIGYERIEDEDPTICPEIKCTCSNTPNGVCNSSAKLVFGIMNTFIFLMISLFYKS